MSVAAVPTESFCPGVYVAWMLGDALKAKAEDALRNLRQIMMGGSLRVAIEQLIVMGSEIMSNLRVSGSKVDPQI